MRIVVATIFFIVAVLFTVNGAMAATTEGIILRGCGFVTSPNTCSDAAVYQCNVSTFFNNPTTSSTIPIVGVEFQFDSGDADSATLSSGTSTNGTWQSSFNVETYNADMAIRKIYVDDQYGNHCEYDYRPSSGEFTSSNDNSCAIEAYNTNNQSISASCTCEYTVTSDVCGTNNVRTKTYTPSAGCIGLSAYTVYGVCDYCDPGFVSSFDQCRLDLTSNNSLVGEAVLTYTPATDPTCCAQTGLDSDCQPPGASGVAVACYADYWATGGRSLGYGTVDRSNELVDTTTILRTTSLGGAWIPDDLTSPSYAKPLVGRFSADDTFTRVVVQTHDGVTANLVSAEPPAFGLQEGATVYDDWNGPAVLDGFADIPGVGPVFDEQVVAQYKNVNVVAFAEQGGNQYLGAYDVVSPNLVWEVNLTAIGIRVAGGAGSGINNKLASPVCVPNTVLGGPYGAGTNCYFAGLNISTNRVNMYRVNVAVVPSLPTNPTLHNLGELDTGSGYEQDDNIKMMYFNSSGNERVLAFFSNNRTWVCQLDSTYSYLPTQCDMLGEISLTGGVTAMEVVDVSSAVNTSGDVQMYATVRFTHPSGPRFGIWSSAFKMQGAGAYTSIVVRDIPSGSSGGSPSCISNPVAGQCSSGVSGVIAASKWNVSVTTGGSSEAGSPTLNFRLSSNSSQIALYNNHNCGLTTGECMTVCSSGTCYLSSGRTSADLSAAQLYVSQNRGTWNPISHAPGESDTTHKGLWSIGSFGGNLYALYGGGNETSRAANQYYNMTLYKYSGGSWSKLSTFTRSSSFTNSSTGAFVASTQYPMYCDAYGCAVMYFRATVGGSTYVVSEPNQRVIYVSDNGAFMRKINGTMSGVNLSITPSVGYTEVGSTAYYAYYLQPGVHPSVLGGRHQLVRYSTSNFNSPTALDQTASASEYIVGLSSIGDRVVYGVIAGGYNYQSITPMSSLCVFNGTIGSANQSVWKSSAESISGISGTGRYLCPWVLKTATTTPTTMHEETVWVLNGWTSCSGLCATADYIHAFGSKGGEDANGDPFVTFVYNPIINNAVFPFAYGGPSRVVLSSKGAYFPVLHEVTNVMSWQYVSLGQPCSSITSNSNGSGCRPATFDSHAVGNAYMDGLIDVTNLAFELTRPGTSTTRSIWRYFSGINITPVTTGIAEYIDYSCYRFAGSSLQRVATTTRPTVLSALCPNIAGLEVNGGGSSEVVSNKGVYSIGSGTPITEFSFSANDQTAVAPVDITTEGRQDFVLVTDTNLRFIVSQGVSSNVYGDLDGGRIVCSISGSKIGAYFSEVSAPNDRTFTFRVENPKTGYVATIGPQIDSYMLHDLTGQSPGNYTISGSVRDSITSLVDEAVACTVMYVAPEVSIEAEGCAAGSSNFDGSFNYEGSVFAPSRGWTPGFSVREDAQTVSKGVLSVYRAPFQMSHDLDCMNTKMRMSTRFSLSSQTSKVSFDLLGSSLSDEEQKLVVGGFTLQPSLTSEGTYDLYFRYPDGEYEVGRLPEHNYVSSLLTGQYVEANVTCDVTTYTCEYSDSLGQVRQFEFANRINGVFSGVSMSYESGDGTLYVDYIKADAIGTTSDTIDPQVATIYSSLGNCVESEYLTNGYDPKNREGMYKDVQDYCTKLGKKTGDSYCDYSALAEAVRYNPLCYNQAYQYCVQVTFPKDSGKGAASFAGVEMNAPQAQQSGLDGAGVCTMVLGTNTVTNRVVGPTLSAMGTLFLKYWLQLAIVLAIAVIVAAVMRRR